MAASSKMDEVFQDCAKVSGLNSLKDFQRDCIENLICGNDVFVCCKTGSGKFLKCNMPVTIVIFELNWIELLYSQHI